MRAQYIQTGEFVGVLTPHFLENLLVRKSLLPEVSIESILSRMWAVGIEEECCGFKFGQGFVYYKCKWNVGRNRWELELISFTPGANFHTRARDFAIEVQP